MGNRLVLTILVSLSCVWAQGENFYLSRLNYGSSILFNGARSMALGASGIAGATAEQSLYINPALLHHTNNKIVAELNLSSENREEDRAFPYFDNFGGFVDYGTYVFNSNWYTDATFHLAADLSGWVPLSVGIGVGPYLDYQYDYTEEVRSTDFGDALLAYNKIRSEGRLREIRFGVSGSFYDNLWIGLQINTLWGNILQKSEIDSVDPASQNIRQLENADIEPDGMPLRFLIGVHYRVNERFSIGAILHLPHEINYQTDYTVRTQDVTLARPLNGYDVYNTQFISSSGTYDSTASVSMNRKISYPLSYGLGLEYRFTNILEARISADFEYTYWSDFKDNLSPRFRFNDTYTIRVGVEHIFFDQLPFRVGFLYGPLREDRQNTRTVLTAGIGLLLENVQVDLSAGIENLISSENDIFDDGKYPSYESRFDPVDRVERSYFYSMLGIRFHLNMIEL